MKDGVPFDVSDANRVPYMNRAELIKKLFKKNMVGLELIDGSEKNNYWYFKFSITSSLSGRVTVSYDIIRAINNEIGSLNNIIVDIQNKTLSISANF